MKKKIPLNLLLFFVFIFHGCFTTTEPIDNKVKLGLNKKQNFLNSKLKWNGMYVNVKNTNVLKYKYNDSYCFYKNNLISRGIGYAIDSITEVNQLINYGAMQTYIYWWGTYSLKDDTIEALIYWPFNRHNANLFKNTVCHYEGIIMNGDSIIEWRMIPPYPKYDKDFNPDYISTEIKSKKFYFLKFPAKLMVDSNKVWLNKYREH